MVPNTFSAAEQTQQTVEVPIILSQEFNENGQRTSLAANIGPIDGQYSVPDFINTYTYDNLGSSGDTQLIIDTIVGT
jgi:hypothetical protein